MSASKQYVIPKPTAKQCGSRSGGHMNVSSTEVGLNWTSHFFSNSADPDRQIFGKGRHLIVLDKMGVYQISDFR